MNFLLIAIFVVGFLLLSRKPTSRRRPPQYIVPQKTGMPDISSFADVFDVVLDKDGEDFFKTQRLKEDLQRITAEAKLASTEAAVGTRLNDLDRKQNDINAHANDAAARIQMAQNALEQKHLEVKTGAAQNTIQQQIIESKLAQFEAQKQAFANHIEKHFHELTVREKELKTTQYFFEKYKTLELDKISYIHQHNRFELAQDKAFLENMSRELSLREERVDVAEDALQLFAREKRLELKREEYKYLETRAVKYLGYNSLESYLQNWRSWDNLAVKNGYESVDTFVSGMLSNGRFADLLGKEGQLSDLKRQIAALPPSKNQ